jgi:hypothetical protein
MKLEPYIKNLSATADSCHKLSEILIEQGGTIEEMSEKLGINIITYTGEPRVILEITDLNKLSDVRRVLRVINGEWKDELRQVWTSGKNVLVSWGNADNKFFEIWLCTTPEEFPEELKGKNCHFEDRVTVDKVLVCKS